MKQNLLSLDCGGLSINFSFLFPETAGYFGKYLNQSSIQNSKSGETVHLQVTPEYMEENRWLVDENEKSLAYLEFQSLMLATGNTLLGYYRALFHGPAFIWRNLAWIFTAPSGTGKTTQLRNWGRILGKEIQVINGDKPLLECREDGSIWVHSSPWRGKERIGKRGKSARLGGIVLLEQGKDNKIYRLDPGESAYPLFTEFVSYPETCLQIRQQKEILEQILDAVPVWKLINLGDKASARITIETIERYLNLPNEKKNSYIPKESQKYSDPVYYSTPANARWKILPGVELIEIKENYLLIADKEARKTCRYINLLNEQGTVIWKGLLAGKTMEKIIAELGKMYEVSDLKLVDADVRQFLHQLEEQGYLLSPPLA